MAGCSNDLGGWCGTTLSHEATIRKTCGRSNMMEKAPHWRRRGKSNELPACWQPALASSSFCSFYCASQSFWPSTSSKNVIHELIGACPPRANDALPTMHASGIGKFRGSSAFVCPHQSCFVALICWSSWMHMALEF